MTQVTFNPAQVQPVVTDAGSASKRPQGSPGQAGGAPANAVPTDTVALSPAAQAASTATARPVLTEADARQTSANLRQALGANGGLSVSARQNQAILSLLR